METLLNEFIRKQLEFYVEPSRKGRPKGDKIGFTKNKFHASLLKLKNLSLKQIALKIPVSYNSIRHWDITPDFKQKVKKNKWDFVYFFLEFAKKDKDHKLIEERLSDLKDYDPELIIIIMENLFERIKTLDGNTKELINMGTTIGWLSVKLNIRLY